MPTTAQRRPFRVQYRNAISQNRNTDVGRRFPTEAEALTYAKNPANHEFNNSRIRVSYDPRDDSPTREIWTSLWA
jgi:hypothetical protein